MLIHLLDFSPFPDMVPKFLCQGARVRSLSQTMLLAPTNSSIQLPKWATLGTCTNALGDNWLSLHVGLHVDDYRQGWLPRPLCSRRTSCWSSHKRHWSIYPNGRWVLHNLCSSVERNYNHHWHHIRRLFCDSRLSQNHCCGQANRLFLLVTSSNCSSLLQYRTCFVCSLSPRPLSCP